MLLLLLLNRELTLLVESILRVLRISNRLLRETNWRLLVATTTALRTNRDFLNSNVNVDLSLLLLESVDVHAIRALSRLPKEERDLLCGRLIGALLSCSVTDEVNVGDGDACFLAEFVEIDADFLI